MNDHVSAYNLWSVVFLNSAVFIIFAFSFTRPRTARDWRSFGAFAGFIIALFTEMYGFPLTIYLLSGWLARHYPAIDPLSHDSGHLWWSLLGGTGDPHLNPVHFASNFLIAGGFVLLASAWRVLYAAQRTHTLAVTGPYARVRHPQYIAFVAILLGFVLQWPTFPTVIMLPLLATMYVRLAKREEAEVLAEFGDAYRSYMATTPAFIPRFQRAPETRGAPRRVGTAR